MLTVKGVYKDGKVIIKEEIKTDKPLNVMVTFLEEVKAPGKKKLEINNFSFKTAKKLLESYKGSLSDAIIEERRSAV